MSNKTGRSRRACRACGVKLTGPKLSYLRQRGVCSEACLAAAPLRVVTCENTSCRRGPGGTRRVFETDNPEKRCCCPNCNTTRYRRERGWITGRDRRPIEHTRVDLPAATIDRLLELRARQRKQARTRLTSTDAWSQLPGAALHHQPITEARWTGE